MRAGRRALSASGRRIADLLAAARPRRIWAWHEVGNCIVLDRVWAHNTTIAACRAALHVLVTA